MLTVQKYGGSSLADPEKIRRAAARCIEEKRRGRDVVLVVSAMGDTTDELLALAWDVSSDPSVRELDALLSTGECVSAALTALTLEGMGCPACSLSGWQSGIFTDAAHGAARIETLTAMRVRDLLARGVVPVVTGFQGIDSFGDVTTLGRGGSDTTAVALASALRAERCEICTDVAGIYTADPRLVPAARLLPEIDLRDMLRLSYAGAQVLYAPSLELALERGVTIILRSSDGGGEGSCVRPLEEPRRAPLAGLACRGGTLTLVGRDASGASARMRAELERRGIAVLRASGARGSAELELRERDVPEAMRALHRVFFE